MGSVGIVADLARCRARPDLAPAGALDGAACVSGFVRWRHQGVELPALPLHPKKNSLSTSARIRGEMLVEPSAR